MKTVMTGLLMVNDKDEPIGIDRASGGYPWVPGYLGGVATFIEKDAEQYKKTFPELRVVKFTLTIEES